MGDKLNIICPKVNGYLATLNSTEPLFLGLWNVDQSGFNTCNAGKWGSRRMLRCNVPDFAKIYTLKIQVRNCISNKSKTNVASFDHYFQYK